MFRRETGKPNLVTMTNAISNLYANGDLLYANGSGALIPADATSGAHYGIMNGEITATDDRYTTAGEILVDMLRAGDQVRCDDVDGTLTAALEGTTMDLSNAESVNQAATSKNVVTLIKFISASEGIFVVNALASVTNVATS